MLSATGVVAMATAVVLGFTVMGGNKAAGGEVFLQATSAAGPNPFTPSTATESETTEVTPVTAATSRDTNRTLEVNGAYPGLYGGTRNVASCDVEKQIKFLGEHPAKGKAFAAPLRIRQPEIPAYLRSLTPVRLAWDTRVTNHGYKNDAPVGYQAILQAGTPVLVDDRGVPRVRCACGNPLAPPVAVKGKQTYSGKQWSSFRSSGLVAVKPAEKPVKAVTMFDQHRKGWYVRPSGDVQGRHDHEVPPPQGQKPDSPYPVLPPPHEETEERHPGQHPGKVPGQDPDKQPGKVPDTKPRVPHEDPEKVPDTKPEKVPPDRNPEKVPDRNPEKVPGTKPEKVPDQNPEKEKVPDTKPEKVPDQNPQNKPEDVPDTKPDKVPGTKPEKVPDQNPEKEKVPDTKPEKVPNQNPQKEKVPGTTPEKVPDQNPQKVPDTKPQKVPDQNPQKVPDTKPQKVPDQNQQKVPDTKPQKVPDQN
ncbi:DUF6777 domain-containing protein, partial [Streptomyces sp. NPDC056224]|uniref:DUF6777 domain-containing protein n=1 Tax=Streptomyces sp. NPDC056224 TaxID=3345750 RepID=UPI0035DEFF42